MCQWTMGFLESRIRGSCESCAGHQGRETQDDVGYAGFEKRNGVLMNRCDTGSDGKTPLQRLHGRRDNTPILEFGEKILCMPVKPARGGKWEPRLHPGVFVGMLNSFSEAVVVTEQGLAIRTRSANIRETWDADSILRVRATPCSPDGSDNAFDIQVGMERPAEMVPRDPGEVLMENKVARTPPSQGRLRAVVSQRSSSRVPVFENWPGETTSEQ